MPVGLDQIWVLSSSRSATSPTALSRRGAEVPNWCRRAASVHTKRTRSANSARRKSVASDTALSRGGA